MKRKLLSQVAGMVFTGAAVFALPGSAISQPAELKPSPAAKSPIATQAPILSATTAGKRIVAVGAYGIILLSDDNGKTYRQAKDVPVNSTLTGVSFADDKHGWTVGQWGAILATEDGGETWKVQRLSTSEDRPLFSVYFSDASNGVAVGLWSLILTTRDGGRTWDSQEVRSQDGKKADGNLFNLFVGKNKELFATSEKGTLLRSADEGKTWNALKTGYTGSLWCGVVLPDGAILAGGQRGTLMRSDDDGTTWKQVDVQSKSSITSIAVKDDQVLVAGLDGLLVLSKDGGHAFAPSSPPAPESFTAVLSGPSGNWLRFSRRGVVPSQE